MPVGNSGQMATSDIFRRNSTLQLTAFRANGEEVISIFTDHIQRTHCSPDCAYMALCVYYHSRGVFLWSSPSLILAIYLYENKGADQAQNICFFPSVYTEVNVQRFPRELEKMSSPFS